MQKHDLLQIPGKKEPNMKHLTRMIMMTIMSAWTILVIVKKSKMIMTVLVPLAIFMTMTYHDDAG
ncbi:unnamed protein product, partial [Symbiodinium necroappetens]